MAMPKYEIGNKKWVPAHKNYYLDIKIIIHKDENIELATGPRNVLVKYDEKHHEVKITFDGTDKTIYENQGSRSIPKKIKIYNYALSKDLVTDIYKFLNKVKYSELHFDKLMNEKTTIEHNNETVTFEDIK